MAAANEVIDRNTGLPMSLNASSLYNKQDSTEVVTSQTGGQTVNEAGTAQTQKAESGFQVQSQNILNTTPAALSALHSLIASLTDRPAISQEELNKKAPLTTPFYTASGWMYKDPLTGRTLSNAEALQVDSARKSERIRLTQIAGTVEGGTEQQKKTQAERTTEITRNRTQQGDYTKGAAMADANALMNKAIADSMRQAMPGITAASEGAGTSKNTFRAQALQEAATRGGIEGAAQGANLSVQYGQIFNQMAGVLEALTRQDPNGPAAMLIQALNTAKGIAVSGTTTTSSSSTGSQNQQTQGTKIGSPETKTSTNVTTYQKPTLPGAQQQAYVSPPIGNQQPTDAFYRFAPGVPTQPTQSAQAEDTFDTASAYQALTTEEY